MKKLTLLGLGLLLTPFISLQSHSATYDDEIRICYLVTNGKISKAQPCVYSHGSGSGGGWEVFSFNNKEYMFECDYTTGNCTYALPNERYKNVESYQRNNGFYDEIESEHYSENAIDCYRSRDRQIDFCYK